MIAFDRAAYGTSQDDGRPVFTRGQDWIEGSSRAVCSSIGYERLNSLWGSSFAEPSDAERASQGLGSILLRSDGADLLGLCRFSPPYCMARRAPLSLLIRTDAVQIASCSALADLAAELDRARRKIMEDARAVDAWLRQPAPTAAHSRTSSLDDFRTALELLRQGDRPIPVSIGHLDSPAWRSLCMLLWSYSLLDRPFAVAIADATPIDPTWKPAAGSLLLRNEPQPPPTREAPPLELRGVRDDRFLPGERSWAQCLADHIAGKLSPPIGMVLPDLIDPKEHDAWAQAFWSAAATSAAPDTRANATVESARGGDKRSLDLLVRLLRRAPDQDRIPTLRRWTLEARSRGGTHQPLVR